ncbi:MAG: PIG-L deacetylase family protein [Vicinamibacterales bacterium]
MTLEGPPFDGPLDSTVFDGRRVLAVTAHPDDETLAFGGSLARCAATGGRSSLLCLTRGELGWAGGTPRPSDIPRLAEARTRELHEAARVLGIADVRVLDFPDSRLHELAYAPMVDAILQAVRALEPDVLITFGEDGLYWHRDHIVVFYTTVQAMRLLGTGAPEVYHAVLLRGTMRRFVDALGAARHDALDAMLWGLEPDAFGLHAERPDFGVDVRPFVARKLEALRCHRTQFDAGHPFLVAPAAAAERLLGIEYYHRGPGEPVRPT